MAFSMIVSLYTVRVVLQVLGVEDYGIYSAVGGIISSLTIFTGALSSASQRFFSIEIGKGDNIGLNKAFNSLTLLYLIAGILILIITETVGVWFLSNKMQIPADRLHAAYVILQCTLFSFFVSIIISPFQAIIIAKEDMKIYAYVGIYDVIVKLLIAFSLRLFHTDKLILYGFLLLLSSISTQLIYFFFTIKQYKEINIGFKGDLKTIKEVLGFTGWSFVGCIAFLFNAQGLNLLMNVFYGPVVNAAYSIGQSVKNAVNQLGTNFFTAVRPNLIKEFAANNYCYVVELFYFSSKVVFTLLFLIVLPIILETECILSLWLDSVENHMVSFVRLMLIWTMILLMGEPITAIVQAGNKVKRYHLTVDLFTLLTLPLSYVAFKLGTSPESGFLISIIIFILAHFIRLLILKKIINISVRCYFKKVLTRIILAIFISFTLSYLLRNSFDSRGFIFFFMKILLEVIIAVSISYMIVFNKFERARINNLLKLFVKRRIR